MNWPERWREVLGGPDPELARRVRQGVATYRSGRVSDVRLDIGRVSARIQGSRATPFLVEISIPTLSDDEWDIVLDHLASTVRYSARLLAGQHPEGLEGEVSDAGVELFPTRADISVAAGHSGEDPFPVAGAAVWEAVGVRLDSGPFPLFQLRGRGRERILRDIARRRRSTTDTSASGIAVEDISPLGWTQPSTPLDALTIPRVREPRTAMPAMQVLGEPDGWAGALSPADLVAPVVQRAAVAARGLLDGRADQPGEDELGRGYGSPAP